MRAESEMYDIIIRTAESDDRVLAAYLKGSRANPNAHKDICQDFDIMYVVKETESFRTDLSWMEPFGKVILKQEQDDAFGYGERFKIQDHYDETYSWLLLFDSCIATHLNSLYQYLDTLFEDGNRIDIGVETLEAVQKGSNRNKLFVPLLDKTGCLPQLPPPTDEEFFTYPQSYEEGFMKYMEFLRSQK